MIAIAANNIIFTNFLSKCMQVNFRNFPTFVTKSIDFTKFSKIWYFHNMHCAFYFIDWVDSILFESQCIFYFFTTNYSPKIFSNIKVLFASFLFWHCLQNIFASFIMMSAAVVIGARVAGTQCGKLRFFLLLRFYVKSSLAN